MNEHCSSFKMEDTREEQSSEMSSSVVVKSEFEESYYFRGADKQLLSDMGTSTFVKILRLPVPVDFRLQLNNRIQDSRCVIWKLCTENDSVKYEIVCERTEYVVNEEGKKRKVDTKETIKIPESAWDIHLHFFGKPCKWVVDNFDDIYEGVLVVKIGLSTPIRSDVNIVKFMFDEDDFDLKVAEISTLPEQIFKDLKRFQNDVLVYNSERIVQHENLLAFLRPYQTRAVQWMISRECDEFRMQSPDCIYEPAHKLKSMQGTELLYYPYSDILLKRPKPTYDLPESFRGGILADEMGLGKTVVVLSLILNNPREMPEDFLVNVEPEPEVCVEDGPSSKKQKIEDNAWEKLKYVKCVCRDKSMTNVVQCPQCSLYQHRTCLGYEDNNIYFCSACWEKKLVKSKATLIIVPQSILQQWKDEIEKHVDDEAWDKGVFVYKGLGNRFVQPSVLASYDIVLTTYKVLSDEFDYTNMRRKSGLFLKQVPPLLHVEWWRLCLDEAQMVETGRTKQGYFIAGTMAKSIPAISKWNITGTPVRSSIDELYNLISWIGVRPFDDEDFWQSLLIHLYGRGYVIPLFSVLSQVFWRNSKQDVENELTIPELTTVYHPLKFTPIELSFYMREHDALYANFRSKLNGPNFVRSLNKRGMTLERILAPMLNLRQACSHHLAVRDNEIANQGKDGINYMTLGSLLEYLVEKTRSECDKSLKGYLDSMSRLAGVSCLEDEWAAAVDYYKKALLIIKEYETKNVKIDPLQNVHITVNLGEILRDNPDIQTTFSVKELKKMTEDIDTKHMQDTVDDFNVNKEYLKNITENVALLQMNIKNVLWARLIASVPHATLMDHIEEKVSEDDTEFLENVGDDPVRTIDVWCADLAESRRIVLELLKALCDEDVDDLVTEAVNCHLRKQRKKYCRLCNCKSLLSSYKKFIFANSQSKTHNVEILMKIVLTLSQVKNAAFRNCEKYVEVLQVMKEEFKQFKAVLKVLEKKVTAKDKLIASKQRKDESNVEDLDELQEKLTEKSQTTMSTLRKKHGTLLYLQNLDRMSNGTDPDDRDPCTICFGILEKQWCVLQCGHSYCTDCVKELLKKEKDLQCPICREVTASSDIGYVDISKKDTSRQKSVHYSTKIASIVDTLLNLKESDPDVKVLIFSTWDIVLTVLKQALDENCISHRKLPGENAEKTLEDFKSSELKITALLFPISYGCTGLNLIEAKHVFFIEPTVNMAEEQQAIARIHRMGQTKETFVHRFYMSGTIEEKIQKAVQDAKYMPKYFTVEEVQTFYE